jgi:hypothetical protein
MPTRDELDAIAWRTLDDHVASGSRPEGRRGGMVHNYQQLGEVAQLVDFPHAWSEFLHGFFHWKDAGAFALAPPETLGREQCAMLAGAAEYLCHRYGFPVPSWTEEPQFFLSGRFEFLPLVDLWVPWPWFESRGESDWERIPEEFRRRGLYFEARNLITL